ncbi:MAG TPA: invasion associated locus B family protein [Xanthobacteraceae bacterium]|nr:invasion associated locus B family protein [Xanthobacteraceae bacterium]
MTCLRHWLLAPLAATLMVALSVASQAQDVAAWRVECTGDGKVLDCRAVQQLFQRIPNQGDRLLVAVLVRRPTDPKAAAAQMTIQLPLGLNLTEAIQVKVDGGTPERQPIQTCTNIGCFVSMAVNEKLLATMRTGKELKITVQDPSKKPVDLSLPLLGFGLAFDKVR